LNQFGEALAQDGLFEELRSTYDAEEDLNAFYSKLGVKTKVEIPRVGGSNGPAVEDSAAKGESRQEHKIAAAAPRAVTKSTAVAKEFKGTELEVILDCEMNWE